AELSGMEFSNAYAIAPEFTTLTKTAYYSFATFYREDGSVLEGAGSRRGRSVIARALLREKVYCVLDRADAETRARMRRGQPNFFLTFDRLGIDPFTQRFPITLLLEGTVRGTGGIRVVASDTTPLTAALVSAGAEVRSADGALLVSGLEAAHVGEIALRCGIALRELTPQHTSLEEVFMELTAAATPHRSGSIPASERSQA
ncbi:MAG UNVERIFIED_CONTAM: hypothetical protein LOD86_04795, partial [Thermobifida fusca]